MDDAAAGGDHTSRVVTHFREMLMALLPAMPVELIQEEPDLADLYAFQCHRLEALPSWLDARARQLLSEQGLPRQAAPFLSFFDGERAGELSASLPAPGLAIGHDGGGNLLAIDAGSGEVVMWDHDNGDARVFVNRDLLHFAACLCEFPYFVEDPAGFLPVVADIDPQAAAEGSFWRDEH